MRTAPRHLVRLRPTLHPLVRRRTTRLLAVVLVASALTIATTSPSQAGTMVRECKASGTSCVKFAGYAGKSVWGYPVSSKGTNCVNYVAYRLARNGVARQSTLGNGGSWASNAKRRGFRVDKTPKVGSIAQWSYGSAYAPGYGHVGYVEEVTSSYVVISDTSYSGGYSSRWRVPKGDRNWPSNFIHFKDIGYQPPASGSFLRVRETNALYRLAGRAPVRVWSKTGLGTVSPYLVSSTALSTLPAHVPDGTFLRGSVRGDVYRVTGGAPVAVTSWASMGGQSATVTVDQRALDQAGAGGDYNRMRRLPVDGTVLKELTSGRLYLVKSGRALRFTSWSQIGGQRPTQPVDPAAVSRAGTTTQYKHLLGQGTYVAPAAPHS